MNGVSILLKAPGGKASSPYHLPHPLSLLHERIALLLRGPDAILEAESIPHQTPSPSKALTFPAPEWSESVPVIYKRSQSQTFCYHSTKRLRHFKLFLPQLQSPGLKTTLLSHQKSLHYC